MKGGRAKARGVKMNSRIKLLIKVRGFEGGRVKEFR